MAWYGWRFRLHAGLSPPAFQDGEPNDRPFDSRRSSSLHGMGGLRNPIGAPSIEHVFVQSQPPSLPDSTRSPQRPDLDPVTPGYTPHWLPLLGRVPQHLTGHHRGVEPRTAFHIDLALGVRRPHDLVEDPGVGGKEADLGHEHMMASGCYRVSRAAVAAVRPHWAACRFRRSPSRITSATTARWSTPTRRRPRRRPSSAPCRTDTDPPWHPCPMS